MSNWHELFRYCDGKLYWKINANSRARIGDEARSLHGKGYLHLQWKGKRYLVHRIIYEMAYDSIPDSYEIDHVNGIRTDNRLDNLRLATGSQNMWNSSKRKDNTSGFKGVSWDKHKQKWKAQIQIFNKNKNLGRFSTKEEAYAARLEAEKIYHGEFVPSEDRKLVVSLNGGNESE
jgi:hypothetical protein